MKKICRIFTVSFLVLCFVAASSFFIINNAAAAKITSTSQAKKKALNKVKNGVVTKIDKDYEDGKLVYEVDLYKGTKKYELDYRASDGKLISYKWEKKNPSVGTGNLISEATCKKLALKKVKNGTITSIDRDDDGNRAEYEVKLNKGNKHYTLEYNARTGKLIEYKWKI